MIVLDETSELIELIKLKGLEFTDFFDHLKTESLVRFNKYPLGRRPEVVILNYSTLLNSPIEIEDFKIQINTYSGVVIFVKDSKERRMAESFALELPKVLGIFDHSLSESEAVVLGNLLSFFWNTTQEQRIFQQKMYQLSIDIEKLMEGAQEDMLKAKALHEKFLPKRTETIKGLQFSSKFMTGSGRGVEFFDLIANQTKCFSVFLTTDSYLVSGSLLSILEQHKNGEFNPTTFLKDAWSDIKTIQESKANPISIDLAVLEIDLNELILKFHGQSKMKILSNGVSISLTDDIKLRKDDKYVVLSAGLMRNIENQQNSINVEKLYSSLSSRPSHEVLNEMIFKVKSEQLPDQELNDMVAVMMEVNRHGIHQV